jgi:hypothetical protein
MPYPEQFPPGRLARFPVGRADAQSLPKLRQSAQNSSFGHLAPQDLSGFGGAECAVLVQCLPQIEHQGRDLVPGGFLRRMLPIRIGTQAKHVGKRLAVGQKIRLLAHCAEQVQGDHAAGRNHARQQPLCLLDGRHAGCSLRTAYAGFDKGGRRRRQLRAPR